MRFEHQEFDDGHASINYRYDVSLPKLAAGDRRDAASPIASPCRPGVARSDASRATTSTTRRRRGDADGDARARARRGRAARRAVEAVDRARLAAPARRLGRLRDDRAAVAGPACRRPAARSARAAAASLQHMAYAAQLRWKTERVPRRRRRTGAGDVAVADCVASPRPLGYRNKSKLVCARAAGGGALVLGAYAPRSHDVVDLRRLPHRRAAARRRRGRAARPARRRRRRRPTTSATLTGDLRYAVLRVNHPAQVLVTLVTARAAGPTGPAWRARCAPRGPRSSAWCRTSTARAATRSTAPRSACSRARRRWRTIERRCAVRLVVARFFQANRDVAALAYAAIAEAAAPTGASASSTPTPASAASR